MALTGLSFTAEGSIKGRPIRTIELPRSHDRRRAIRDEIAAVRDLLEEGADYVRVITWNNWRDWMNSLRYQSCSLVNYERVDGRLRRRRINIF